MTPGEPSTAAARSSRSEKVVREVRRLASETVRRAREYGPTDATREVANVLYGYAAFPLFKGNRTPGRFSLQGREYEYFRHPYNRAWMNERSVELAVGKRFLEDSAGRRILEVGNVCSHYWPIDHEIVDKYEIAPGVINADIVDFETDQPYDAILALSTLEHVGWDERPADPEKVPRAIKNLQRLLSPGGRLLVTMPIGDNPFVDTLVARDELPFPRLAYMLRISGMKNEWVEVDRKDVVGARYGRPFRNANAVVFGMSDDGER